METYDDKHAQAALEDLLRLRDEANKAGGAAQRVLRVIEPALESFLQKLKVGTDRELPAGVWNGLPDDERYRAQACLDGMLDALKSAGSDEPTDSTSVMYRKHASNIWIYARGVKLAE